MQTIEADITVRIIRPGGLGRVRRPRSGVREDKTRGDAPLSIANKKAKVSSQTTRSLFS